MPNAQMMAGSNRLRHALKALEEHWLTTRESWRDSASVRFEERHLKPLDSATDAAVVAMIKFGDVLDRIRHDLSDRSELK